ncbi:hypothetical protein BD289DRAFT_482222 [Coniella lustricola]|uniref:Uncharacterized protein n=1 Tax=Coniella lustricola TaxID=2025994 RepID=A0A2T3A9I1_9PEZI|nr:hypothetical protein BD289DRAFT_482222 [Coniella lustricola]
MATPYFSSHIAVEATLDSIKAPNPQPPSSPRFGHPRSGPVLPRASLPDVPILPRVFLRQQASTLTLEVTAFLDGEIPWMVTYPTPRPPPSPRPYPRPGPATPHPPPGTITPPPSP